MLINEKRFEILDWRENSQHYLWENVYFSLTIVKWTPKMQK